MSDPESVEDVVSEWRCAHGAGFGIIDIRKAGDALAAEVERLRAELERERNGAGSER